MEQFVYNLKPEQAELIRNLNKDIQDFTTTLKLLAANLETKKKSLDDLISMLCITAGLDKAKIKIDLENNVILQDVVPNE